MGQEVKNPLRPQSKYGLMESSAKTGKFCFRRSSEHFWIKMQFGIGHPSTYTSIALYMCGGMVQGSQTFKRNSIISICSKVMAVLVILLSPLSPHCLHCPHVVPTSSPCRPHHPHIVPKAPRRFPCGHHGCGLRGLLCCLRGLHPMLSPWSPHRPCGPHIVPVSSPLFPHCLEGHHIIPNPSDTHSTDPPPPRGVGGP